MSKGDRDRTDNKERYHQSHDHIFRDGPPVPPVSHDSIEVRVDGEVVNPEVILGPPATVEDLDAVLKEGYADAIASHPLTADPPVYDDALSVKLKYECGSQAFDGIEMHCGMMVAPAPSEKGDGMIVYIAGAPRDILAMVLAAIDSADGFGLRDALKLCIERGVGMNEVSEVLGEEWWMG